MHDESSAAASDRIVTLDAVRGFALLGIVAVHMVEQYLGSPPPASRANAPMSPVDGIAMAIAALLFMGKFFAMFSLLFGLSFFIQMERAAARGQGFEGRFTWRLAVLFAIGMAHHLVYRGDILAIYAVLGLVLLVYYRLSDRWLLASALAILLGAPRLLLGLWTLATGTGPSMSAGEDAAIQAYWNTLKAGSPLAIGWTNLAEGIWPKLNFQFGWFGRGYQTLGLFLLGLYIGRHRWHEALGSRRRDLKRLTWRAAALCAGVVLVAGASFAVAYAAGVMPQRSGPGASASPQQLPPLWLLVGGFTLYDLFNLGVMGTMLGGFLLLYSRPGPHRLLRWFAPVGRTALTTYVAQSVLGGFIFYGYGLNLLGVIGPAQGLALALVVFTGQVIASSLWLQYFRFGPLEWLWRSATYLELQPLVRRGRQEVREPLTPRAGAGQPAARASRRAPLGTTALPGSD
jgi:uncharacterized protein